MSTDYSHLHSAIRPFAEDDNDTRIRRIRTDRWITYSRAEAALAAMEDLLSFPKRTRMPNLRLVGPTKQRQDHDRREVQARPSADAAEQRAGGRRHRSGPQGADARRSRRG